MAIHENITEIEPFKMGKKFQKNTITSEEVSSLLHFPNKPKNETSLLKVKSKKLALPIGAPTFDYTKNKI